jgi:putative transposase
MRAANRPSAPSPSNSRPKSTVRDYFNAWQEDGTWQKLLDALRPQVRTAQGRP